MLEFSLRGENLVIGLGGFYAGRSVGFFYLVEAD
jgi:hypothetical protein